MIVHLLFQYRFVAGGMRKIMHIYFVINYVFLIIVNDFKIYVTLPISVHDILTGEIYF